MYYVTVNGKEWITAHDKTLITFLRDELNLTAAAGDPGGLSVPLLYHDRHRIQKPH